ncbi:MAG TPA: ABC transporter substrate-binding protein [Verrucomicrobiae bacterium]|nr:ABC transporter substrate-binding protein [Verrucomicrobiae bacterium]
MTSRLSRRSFLGGVVAIGGAGALSACAASSPEPARTALRAGSPTPAPTRLAVKAAWVAQTANQMIWPIAKEAGYFDKYGIDFDLSYIAGSSTAVPALISGQIGLTSVAGSAVVSAQAGGSDIVMIAGFLNKSIFRVIAGPGITSIDQLKGKTIAVTRIGNADYFAWQTIAAKQGWQMSDLQFVNGNDVPGQVALLQTGKVQAIAVSPPNNILAVQAGGKEILDTGSFNEAEQQVGVAATRKWASENRAAVLGVLKASIEAMARWPKDAPFVKNVIKTYLKTDDPQYLDVGYSAYANVWPQAPYPTVPGLQRVIEQVATQNAKAKELKPEQMIDNSFVQELESSGFIKQIYK